MDGVVVDGVTIKKENGKLVAVGGGEAGSVAWGNISGKPSVFATNIANITDLHSSWDSVLAAQKPAWLTAVSIATISDLNSGWDALLKAAPSTFVTRWPTISEVTNKQSLIVKLNGGTTEGTNQFTYNATAAKTINITASSIGAAASSHNHSWSNITSGKPTTLAGYGITDAPTKTGGGASGTWAINITGTAGAAHSADSAVKLQNVRKLWGNNFDGTANISGDINGVGNIGALSNNTYNIGTSTTTFRNVYSQYINSGSSGNLYLGANNSNYIIVLGNGNVGIGINPEVKLHVDGIIKTNNNILGRSIETSYGKSTNEYGISLSCYYENNTKVPSGLHRYMSGWSDTAEQGWYTGYGIGSYRSGATGHGAMVFEICNLENNSRLLRLELRSKDNSMWFSGNILAEGGCTFYGSDIRYKSIIQQVKLSLSDIAKAPSFVYHWNREGMKCDRLNLGGSAQYTQSILPWAVEENDNFLSMDYATVAYTFAVHTARHLLTYETRTDKKIKKLEREIVILKKQLKKLGYEEVRTLDDQSV